MEKKTEKNVKTGCTQVFRQKYFQDYVPRSLAWGNSNRPEDDTSGP